MAVPEVMSGERHLLEIALANRTFAGSFVENGQVVVLGTEPGRLGDVVRAYRTSSAAARRWTVRPGFDRPIQSRAARYTFLELAHWRNQIFETIWSHESVYSIDLDERTNRIVVGVGPEGIAQVQERIDMLGLPHDAWIIEAAAMDRPNTKAVTARQRPTQGGLRVLYEIGTGLYGCTHGFNALLGGELVFLTNSHCSPGQFTLSTSHEQAQGLVSGAIIGHEVADPSGWDCSSFWPFTQTSSNCREADAAAYDYTIDDDSVGLGLLARHLDRHEGELPYNAPPRQYDETDPFEIVELATQYDIEQGETVEKLGRTTGWTYGEVTETCARKKYEVVHGGGHFTVLCSYSTDYWAEDGDSGGPVFVLHANGDEVTLAGIHHGSNGDNEGRFSPVFGIEEDIGEFAVRIDGGLSAFVSGPSVLPSGLLCTWYGSASGGAPPYTYSWSGVASGSGASVDAIVNSSGWLVLTVTDQIGLNTNYTHWITIDEGASTPPGCTE